MANQVVANPSAVVARPLTIPHSDLLKMGEPPTRWVALAVNTNEEVLKTHRATCKNLAFLGGALFIVGYVFYHNRHRTIVHGTLFFFSAVSLVSSAIFGYKSLGKDNRPLLQQREEVKNNLEKFSLGRIRKLYPDEEVISNKELNEWARYFLHTKTFDNFMDSQWSTIFGFEHETETKKLIEEQFLYRVYHPDNPENLQLFQEVLTSALLSEPERIKLAHLKSAINKHLAGNSTAFWLKYKEVREKKAWKVQDPDLKTLYAWLLTLYVWKLGIGIINLKKDFQQELEFFFSSPAKIYSYIADRDAQLEHVTFVEKNGVEAIGYLTNYHTFVKFVLQADLGFVKTKELFSSSIKRFGELASTLAEEILLQEWKDLAKKTYTEIRERTGIRAFELIKDQAIKDQLVEKFLRLPPVELSNRGKYKEDIEALGITDRQIQIKIAQSWGTMTIKEILALNKEHRKLIFKEWDAVKLKNKALEEIKGLPIDDIIRDYIGLVETGILTNSDYNFSEQLIKLDVHHLSTLLNSHGEFILKFQLLSFNNLHTIVSIFICQNVDVFFSDSGLPFHGMGKVIHDYKLIPENVKKLREETIKDRETENKRHQFQNQRLEQECTQAKQAIGIAIKQKKDSTEAAYRRHKANLDQAIRELAAKEADQRALQVELDDLQPKALKAKLEHDNQKSLVEDILQKQERIKNISQELLSLPKKLSEVERDLRNGEVLMINEKLNGQSFETVQTKVDKDEAALAELIKTIPSLKNQHAVLSVKASKEVGTPPQRANDQNDAKEGKKMGLASAVAVAASPPTSQKEPESSIKLPEPGDEVNATEKEKVLAPTAAVATSPPTSQKEPESSIKLQETRDEVNAQGKEKGLASAVAVAASPPTSQKEPESSIKLPEPGDEVNATEKEKVLAPTAAVATSPSTLQKEPESSIKLPELRDEVDAQGKEKGLAPAAAVAASPPTSQKEPESSIKLPETRDEVNAQGKEKGQGTSSSISNEKTEIPILSRLARFGGGIISRGKEKGLTSTTAITASPSPSKKETEPSILKELTKLGEEIDAKEKLVTSLRSKIEQQKAAVQAARDAISQDHALLEIRQKKEEYANQQQKLIREKSTLEEDCRGLGILKKNLEQAKDLENFLREAEKKKQEQLDKVLSSIKTLTQNQENAKATIERSQYEIDNMHETLQKKEADDKKACDDKLAKDKEAELGRHTAALEQIKTTAHKSLQSIYNLSQNHHP